MIKYVCDKCGKSVKRRTELFNVRRVESGDSIMLTETNVPDLCRDCIDTVFRVVNSVYDKEVGE